MSNTLAPAQLQDVVFPSYGVRGQAALATDDTRTAVPALRPLHQRPVSVTLDAPSIFILALALVFLIHFLGSHATEILVAVTPIFLLVHNDYQNFIGLGPGGTPSTFSGYLRISWLRLWAIRDPFAPPSPDPTCFPREGILTLQPLPYRPGPRPLVAGIAPQRQLDQPGSPACYLALRRAMEKLSARSPLCFSTERSCLEKHGLALFAGHPLQTNCQGEICHVHDSDHSMHMCLHPDDIRELLRKGWGQKHPLARAGWLVQMPVSQDFVMVYAPRSKFPNPHFPSMSCWGIVSRLRHRSATLTMPFVVLFRHAATSRAKVSGADEQELQITYRIIEAAIWYILAESVELDRLPNRS